MLLVGVKEEAGWLMSRWNLTYPVEWDKLCKAVHFVYDYYADVEILMDGQQVQIGNKMELLRLKEVSNLTVRGMSKIIGPLLGDEQSIFRVQCTRFLKLWFV